MAAQQVPECVGLRVRQRRGGVRVVSRFCRRRSKLRHGRHRAAAHLLRKHRDGQFLPLTDLDPRGGPLAQPSPPLGQQQQPWAAGKLRRRRLGGRHPQHLGLDVLRHQRRKLWVFGQRPELHGVQLLWPHVYPRPKATHAHRGAVHDGPAEPAFHPSQFGGDRRGRARQLVRRAVRDRPPSDLRGRQREVHRRELPRGDRMGVGVWRRQHRIWRR